MTSATLDGEKFSTYFDECPVLHIPGRCFPVSVAYAVEVPASYQEEVVNLALDIHCDHPPGDVLIFMTGQVRRDGPLHVARSLSVCVCLSWTRWFPPFKRCCVENGQWGWSIGPQGTAPSTRICSTSREHDWLRVLRVTHRWVGAAR